MAEENRFPITRELKMPKMGESITEGTIIEWLISEGDTFEEGDIILEVATDKVDNEVPAPASGKLIKQLAEAKAVIAVGEPIAVLELSEGSIAAKNTSITTEDKSIQPAKKASSKKIKKVAQVTSPRYVPSSLGKLDGDNFFSPLIISIAKEHHISFEELARIPATGNEGRLRKSDVFNYINDGRPYQFVQPVVQDPTAYRIPQLHLDKGTGKIVKMDRMRQMIADHMVYSKHTSPHVTAYVEADLTNLVNWRNDNKVKFQKKIWKKINLYTAFC